MNGVTGVNGVSGVTRGADKWAEQFIVAEHRAPYNGRPLTHKDLKVYERAFNLALELYTTSKGFPDSEKYSLTSQIRRSSRSVCSNIAEGWRKRRYKAAFVAKLSDAEAEAAETQTWIEFALAFGYIEPDQADALWKAYESLISTIVGFIDHADDWIIK